MSTNIHLTVRLPETLKSQIDRAAESDGDTVSAIIRKSLQLYMMVREGATEADKRRQFSSEFVFLAMERWVQTNLGDQHEILLGEADRRTEALYA
jgi:Arc/MetJ-type ribon-helix-helix transcriptional regulator